MEDFVRVVQPFAGDGLYAAVFDGHGGDDVSRRAHDRLHEILAEWIVRAPPPSAFRSAFWSFDVEVTGREAGAVAVVAVLRGDDLAVANIGDCHALLVSEDGEALLTEDHRVTNEAELRRVTAAGAEVSGRYMWAPDGSGVMTTRAFGDARFKRIGQVSEPATATRTIEDEDRWLVLGSDGVWDPLELDAVAAIARDASTAQMAADGILEQALAVGSDNVSVVVVRL
jgi:serine/threonine protein phosphatase PrpC